MPDPTVYERLIEAGCEVDSHESDLYVKNTEAARSVLQWFPDISKSGFTSEVDGNRWIELPFRFDPFWNRKPR